jgi:hypothetical protein
MSQLILDSAILKTLLELAASAFSLTGDRLRGILARCSDEPASAR